LEKPTPTRRTRVAKAANGEAPTKRPRAAKVQEAELLTARPEAEVLTTQPEAEVPTTQGPAEVPTTHPQAEVPTTQAVAEAPKARRVAAEAPKPHAVAEKPTLPVEDFQSLGRDIFLTGLVSSHTGSLSTRQDDKMFITRRGAMLGRLTEQDLIEVAIGGVPPEGAAEDAVVHQAIYRATDAQSVIYARPPWTMALALVEDRLSPANHDGADNLGSAPVLISQRTIDSPDIAGLVGRTLRESRVAALRGHGVFARGADLWDAFHMVSLLEEMCKVVQIYRTLAREDRQPVGFEQRERQPANNYRPRNDNYGRRPPGGRPPQQHGPSGPPRQQGDGGPPRRPPYQPQPRDPNGARRGPPPRH